MTDASFEACMRVIRREWDRRGWSQDEMAERCGVTKSYISHYIHGRRKSWKLTRRIMAELGLPDELSRSATMEINEEKS